MRPTLLLLLSLSLGCSDGRQASSPAPDASEGIAAGVPAELNCGDRREIALTFQNTGSTTWTALAGYDVRPTAGVDPFVSEPSLSFAETDAIAPGDIVAFALPIRAPGTAGVHASEWRIAKDGTTFGDAASWSLEVHCNRTPDPAPGEALPLPDMSDLIQQIADADPTLIAESCQDDENGNWRFLDTVVDALRRIDTRWGYNWKRGVIGDPSRDVVDYHYGAGPDEESEEVYILDILVDHCGENPHPGWNDVTQATLDGGTIGMWTSRERF